MCHSCHHHHCCCPRYWCSTCVRYTHTLHHHAPQWYVWRPPAVVVQPVICQSTGLRDRQAISALGGARV